MATPPEQNQPDPETQIEFLSPEFVSETALSSADLLDAIYPDGLTRQVSETVLQTLPNDLTRMIYLASLRDCNSGLYLHPELSQQNGVQAADGALRICHERVFRRLLTTRVVDYVNQLQEYIRYTRGETVTVLKTWKSLQAYRATVPVGALATSSELFFLNIGIALEILSQQNPQLRQS